MKKIFTTLGVLLSFVASNAATYYTTGSGNWGSDAIWSLTTNGVGVTWGSLTILADDIIVIDDDITITGSEITINVDVTIQISAELDISKKLNLTEDSIIIFTSTGSVVGSGPGNSEKIRIGAGNNVWSGNNGPITGPGTLDKNSTNGTLPITLSYFNAFISITKIELSWGTASEENNDFFTLERSSNGFDYHELTILDGAGNSFESIEYHYSDLLPLPGVSYYRLKQTDYDGTSETFKPVVVEYYGETEKVKVIQPASSNNELIIFNNYDDENSAVIYDVMGRKIGQFKLSQGENNIDLQKITNQPGIYHLRIFNALGRILKTEKILVR